MSKLKSRKFWITMISVVTGVLSLLNFDESGISAVSGLLLTLVPTVTYIVVEGKIDAASFQNLLVKVSDALKTGGEDDEV